MQLFMVFADGPARTKVETIITECKQSSKRHSEVVKVNFNWRQTLAKDGHRVSHANCFLL